MPALGFVSLILWKYRSLHILFLRCSQSVCLKSAYEKCTQYDVHDIYIIKFLKKLFQKKQYKNLDSNSSLGNDSEFKYNLL